MTEQTATSIKTNRDRLLRCVALDLPRMMKILGKDELFSKLTLLQELIFEVIKLGNCIPASIINIQLFNEIMNDYKKIVLDYMKK